MTHLDTRSCSDGSSDDTAANLTGLSDNLLFEISVHLERLARDGVSERIDLRGLPLTDEDLDDLKTRLGKGEVHATISSAGTSEITETKYPGVWWIAHLGADGTPVAQFIDVTQVPDLMASPIEDITKAAGRLANELNSLKPSPTQGAT